MDWSSILTILIQGVLPSVVSVVAVMLGVLIKKAIKKIDHEYLQEVAFTAVQWVAQRFEKLSNEQKFMEAYTYVEEKTKGSFTRKDMEAAVEAGVKQFKNTVGNAEGSRIKL